VEKEAVEEILEQCPDQVSGQEANERLDICGSGKREECGKGQ